MGDNYSNFESASRSIFKKKKINKYILFYLVIFPKIVFSEDVVADRPLQTNVVY